MLNLCYHKAQKKSFKNERSIETNVNDKIIPMFQDRAMGDSYKTVTNREVGQIIGKALLELPVDYRIVFCLRELNGLSTSEAAETIGITETNVKVRLNRARHMLRQSIEQMYAPGEIFEFNLVYCDNVVNKVMREIDKL
jgi:RNA polymerase sigma-70 factor (ECF subfamily)